MLSGRPIHPRVLALGQSRLLTAMCWDCVRVAGGQPWLSWRAGLASIAGIGTGLGDTLYCRPKFCAVFLCSAFCKHKLQHAPAPPLVWNVAFPICLPWLHTTSNIIVKDPEPSDTLPLHLFGMDQSADRQLTVIDVDGDNAGMDRDSIGEPADSIILGRSGAPRRVFHAQPPSTLRCVPTHS